jgi:nucleotide-binding universal stress UspA family protein
MATSRQEVERLVLADLTAPESCEIKYKSEIIEDPYSSVENAIINYAESEDVDLIVMGTRGTPSFRRILIGSVALGVLSYARCPVVVVRWFLF